MAQEATTVAEARRILDEVFDPGRNDRLAGYRDDYAKMLYFLSDKDLFEAGLVELTKSLWELYGRKDDDAKNKFSTSLLQYGVLAGFPAQSVTILAAGDDDYPTYLKNGILIKDEMDLLHGEYAHSLQWLAAHAVRDRLKLSKSAGELYRALGETGLKSSVNVWHYYKKGKKNVLDKVHLWAYLVDSFPMSMVGDNNQHANNNSLFTTTYRCPQNLTNYLLNLSAPTHFLARYLQWRYLKRQFMTKPDTSGSVKISTGATIKNYAGQKYGKNPDYTALPGETGWVRNGSPVAPDPPKQKPAPTQSGKTFYQATFHGRTGWITGNWDHV
ncbi:MAG TPA: LirA/MavJ family T4SS effector [Terracidiphilus sp.]